MRQNALLRSVKGSGLPNTARQEDRNARLKVAASTAVEGRQEFACKDHFAVRNGVRCAGVHLIVDLHGGKRLNDIDHIEATLRRCIEASRATLLHIHLHHFQPVADCRNKLGADVKWCGLAQPTGRSSLRAIRQTYLTGLRTRGYFEQQLELEFKRAERRSQKFALLMIDIDHFKDLNDTFGHHVATRCCATSPPS